MSIVIFVFGVDFSLSFFDIALSKQGSVSGDINEVQQAGNFIFFCKFGDYRIYCVFFVSSVCLYFCRSMAILEVAVLATRHKGSKC